MTATDMQLCACRQRQMRPGEHQRFTNDGVHFTAEPGSPTCYRWRDKTPSPGDGAFLSQKRTPAPGEGPLPAHAALAVRHLTPEQAARIKQRWADVHGSDLTVEGPLAAEQREYREAGFPWWTVPACGLFILLIAVVAFGWATWHNAGMGY